MQEPAPEQLPHVPLPTVEDSCARFLEWCAPLLTPSQLAETEVAVHDFLDRDSPAHRLHGELAAYDDAPTTQSWLDEFWRDRYLGRRDCIAVNANYFFLFTEFTEQPGGQLTRAAQLIAAALDHKAGLDSGRATATMQRGRPLSMEQHKFLFATTRIPGPVRDTVRTPYGERSPSPADSRHIVVLVNGNIIRLEVLTESGRPYATADLAAALGDILAKHSARGQAVGSLTTLPRPTWAAVRERLVVNPANAAALDAVESALFCLCLETDPAPTDQEACDRLLGGDCGSRWFDKGISLIVFPDGKAGINGEHCCLDGTTVAEFIDHLSSFAAADESPPGSVPAASAVLFDVDAGLAGEIREATTGFERLTGGTAGRLIDIPGHGSTRAKQLGMSPDAYVQLAYQLAHQRARGFVGATYESVSTRRFHHGRTEAMRVVTPEVVRFAAAMDDPSADNEARVAAIRSAAQAHVERAKQCQAGAAPEQHLWELLMRLRRAGRHEVPRLYESPGWTIMRDDYLSTSGVPPSRVRAFGFGATTGHCIGVAYALRPALLTVYLSAPAAIADDLAEFGRQLPDVLDELEATLAAELGKAPS